METREGKSVQPKADRDADLHIDRLTIFHRWLKAPLSYSFDGFGVESETKPADDADISWVSLGINNQPKDASSLALGSSRFLCVFGIRSGNSLRSGNAATDFKNTATDATAASRADAGAMPGAHPTPGTGTDAAS